MLRFTRALVAAAITLTAMPALADTLLQPKRDYLEAPVSEVVWGVTTLANGTPYVLDYGDGTAQQAGNVVDRSYIAFNHVFPASGPKIIQLCVGPAPAITNITGATGAADPTNCPAPNEHASVQVNVYDPATLTPFDLRGLNVNRAIQNGLRYLWFSQSNRAANFPAGVTTSWSGAFPRSMTSLAVLAFENHGYLLPNSNVAPTGIYERFIVQRGLNFIASELHLLTLGPQTAGNPCVGVGVDCVGLQLAADSDPGYATAVAALPFAGSTALSRTFAGLPAGNNAGYPNGKSIGEVLQRMMNAISWGQNDGAAPGAGGWIYGFSNNTNQQSDGSTVGWDILALLDAGAAGTTIPAFVKTEFQTKALPGGLNTDGSFDYRANGNAASNDNVNIAKAGIGLQGQFFVGAAAGAGVNYISQNWTNPSAFGNGGVNFACGNGTWNLGCGYAMFNIFKAFKLHGITTIPGSPRPAGPGPIPANDWYAEYVDWLVANQTSPTSTNGGNWNPLYFSCCTNNIDGNVAIAELILSPVALIQPDPDLFATIGLSQTTGINRPGTDHTVTATATSATNTPVAGVTINFVVQTGPNAGKTGSATTNAAGQATFTYNDDSLPAWPKSDTIQAFIGAFGSNTLTKVWVLPCDANSDNQVNAADLVLIRAANGQAPIANDPRNGNGDAIINALDVRYCQQRFVGPLVP